LCLILILGIMDRFAPTEFLTDSGVLLHRWISEQAKAYDDGLAEWRFSATRTEVIPKIVYGAVATVFLQILSEGDRFYLLGVQLAPLRELEVS
jgi:hypothetical protein